MRLPVIDAGVIGFRSAAWSKVFAVLAVVIAAGLIPAGAIAGEPGASRLIWGSGDSMQGRLLEVTPQELTWQSALFSEPLRIQTSVLQSVSFPPEDPELDEADDFRFTLRNTDTLFGRLTAIDDDTLTIQSSRHGEVVLSRKSVGAVRRINHDGLIYLGPDGRTGWSTATGKKGLDVWKEEADGALSTTVAEASLLRTLRSEDRMALEVVLKFPKRPDFTLKLGKGESFLGLEVWEDALVALAGDNFEEIAVVTKTTGELHLHLYVDFEAKRILVYGPSGRRIADVSNTALKDVSRTFSLRNGNSGVSLQHLRIGRWNGKAVDTLADGEIGIQQVSGDVQRGKLESLNDGNIVLSADGETSTIALDDISMLSVTPADAESEDKSDAQIPAVAIKWRDGGKLSGEIIRIDGQQAVLQPAWSATPVTAAVEGIQQIQLRATATTEDAADVLTVDGETLRGQLIVEDGDRPILWKAAGGLNGVELTSGGDGVIVRGGEAKELTVDSKQWPDIIYLTNDDVIPCRIEKVGEDSVRLSSPFVDAKEVSSRDIKAVELASSGATGSRGFEDADWKVVRRGPVKARGVVSLKGGSLGHPAAMTGDRVGFRMRWPENYTVFTVHVFADSLRNPKSSTSITFITNQNNVFISGDKPDLRNPFAMMQNPGATRTFKGFEAEVELVTRGGKLELLMDGDSVHEIPLNPDGAGETGILFELNQNAGGAVFFNGNVGRVKPPQVKHLELSEFRGTGGSGISIRQFIEDESRRRALTIPRFRRDDPPTHILIAPNGDLLRGRLLAVEEDAVRFESQLEEFRFERERVASIVWLHVPEQKNADEEASGKESEDDEDETPVAKKVEPPENEIQALLNGGFILSFTPEVLAGGMLKGRSSGLAAGCLVPAASILELYMGDPQQRRERAVYAGWEAQNALDPDWDIPEGDGGSASGRELIGATAPDFELPQLDGQSFRLSEHRGRIVVLDFWATWCGPCVLALPDYIDATRDFEDSELTFVAVNLEESSQQIRAFLKKRDLEMRVALDGGSSVASDYSVNGIPHTVVIGPDGTVEYVHVGYDSNGGEELHRIAKQILAGTWDRNADSEAENGAAEDGAADDN